MDCYNLTGKTLVFSDLHLGLKNSNVLRLGICVTVVKEIIQRIVSDEISNVIFCGDLFHSRKNIDINVLNYGFKLVTAIARKAHVYLICGNHDIYYKNIVDINSINIFNDNPNVTVINKLSEAVINGQRALFVPWLADISAIDENSYDLMFGHFDISSKYLIASYIEMHSAIKSSKSYVDNILEDELFADSAIDTSYDLNDEINEIITKKTKSDNLIGSFINIVKGGGVIYAGHIHLHRELISRGRQFVFIGSPYQQTFGEMESVDGYYVLNESNKRTFHEIANAPRFVKLRMSEVLEAGVDKFDFSRIKGNIVKKIYDCKVKKDDDFKIEQMISNRLPAEETLSEYDIQIDKVATDSDESSKVTTSTLDLIRKSKIDYLRSYVESIDQAVLDNESLNREKLLEILQFYYDKIVDEK